MGIPEHVRRTFSTPRTQFPNEAQFRARLASILSHEPYSHSCTEEVSYRTRDGRRGRIDLYLETHKAWEYREVFPVIGIELKMARGMGEVVDAMDQVRRYDDDLRSAEYRIGGASVPVPSLFLVATPDSVETGALYPWNHPQVQRWGREYLIPLWLGVTELYERVLMKHGASVLRNGPCSLGFYSNIGGNHGAVQWYSLETVVPDHLWSDEEGDE